MSEKILEFNDGTTYEIKSLDFSMDPGGSYQMSFTTTDGETKIEEVRAFRIK